MHGSTYSLALLDWSIMIQPSGVVIASHLLFGGGAFLGVGGTILLKCQLAEAALNMSNNRSKNKYNMSLNNLWTH